MNRWYLRILKKQWFNPSSHHEWELGFNGEPYFVIWSVACT